MRVHWGVFLDPLFELSRESITSLVPRPSVEREGSPSLSLYGRPGNEASPSPDRIIIVCGLGAEKKCRRTCYVYISIIIMILLL